MIARSSPARRSAALPIGMGAGASSGSSLLDARIAVQRDVLEVENRIRIGDGRRHQRARILRRRRNDDLQAGRPVEPRFGVLAVIRARRGAGRPTACARPSESTLPQR